MRFFFFSLYFPCPQSAAVVSKKERKKNTLSIFSSFSCPLFFSFAVFVFFILFQEVRSVITRGSVLLAGMGGSSAGRPWERKERRGEEEEVEEEEPQV